MEGPGFGAFATPGGGMGDRGGQEACVAPPPAGVTSVGLGGLGYVHHGNPQGTGELVLNVPPALPANCQLKFCEIDANGNEQPVNLSFDRIRQNPATLPGSTCPATEAVAHCPIDPASKTNRSCTLDRDCNVASGEVCGVFCNDVACATSETRCGRISECGSLAAEPVGPFAENNPASWPCEELRECGETGPVVGFTGDPVIKKTGSLEEQLTPDDGTTGLGQERGPGFYPPFTETLNANECQVPALGSNGLNQTEPRSGGSGNDKWGIFVEPDVQHEANVNAKSYFGDDDFSVIAGATFRTGARIGATRSRSSARRSKAR